MTSFRIYTPITHIKCPLRIIEEKLEENPESIPDPIPDPIPLVPNPEIDRETKAFTIVSHAVSAQLNSQRVGGSKFDLRTYTVNGKTYYPWLFSKNTKT